MEALAEKYERSQAKVGELTRAKKKVCQELVEKGNLCDEHRERVTELLLESEIKQNEARSEQLALRAQIEELTKLKVPTGQVAEVTTQTDEFQEAATTDAEQDRRHEAEVEALM